mmetsp:Transcript_15140/g.19849  ORF Transcript_15140/g.19849 Transcript_15140/m.19849 type:complete len:394 (-) Transcript_15140:478-1659(-)
MAQICDHQVGSPTPSESPHHCLLQTKKWVKKYFWEGQKLAEKAQEVSPDAPWHVRHRRAIAMFTPAIIFHLAWWTFMGITDNFYLFNDRAGEGGVPRWYMTLTMLFGSMIAGATSEGGASVAFPVMTLAFGIAPAIARDFSFMIQSFGMTAAGFTILVMRVQIEYNSLIFTSLGGLIGIILGLEYVAPSLTPAYSKMYFVVIWFAFAFSLYQLNRLYGRKVYMKIPNWEDGVLIRCGPVSLNWKAVVLFAFGILGGIFSAMSGSGIDICSFACLTLLFRVSEKVATPTSVLLMAGNTCIGFLYREFGMGGAEPESYKYLLVCIPIVVLGAPLGSMVGSHFHRLVLASFVYVTDTVQEKLPSQNFEEAKDIQEEEDQYCSAPASDLEKIGSNDC